MSSRAVTLPPVEGSHCPGDHAGSAPDGEGATVANEAQVYRARVDPANAARLLEIRPAAVAPAQTACPALMRAELVHRRPDAIADLFADAAAQPGAGVG